MAGPVLPMQAADEEESQAALTCDAIFENGVFRPVALPSPELANGQHVKLVIQTTTPDEILRLADEV